MFRGRIENYVSSSRILPFCGAWLISIRSWPAVAETLINTHEACRSSSLKSFLQDDLSIQALSNCTRANRPPNGQAKSEFETRTAAINVTQAKSSNYDIHQIKDDALWLARIAKLDELSALRTTVLEWQDRPRNRLLSIHSAGASSGSRSVASDGDGDEDQSPRTRRARLLQLWYNEQQSMIDVRAILAKTQLYTERSTAMITNGNDQVPPYEWLKLLDRRLCRTSDIREEFADTHLAILPQTIDAIRTRAQASQKPVADINDELAQDWYPKLILHTGQEIKNLLQFSLIALGTGNDPPTAPIIANWFQSLGALNFFQDMSTLQMDDALTFQTIEMLSTTIMYTMLQLEDSVRILDINPNSDKKPPQWYALDPSCVEAISTSLASAVDNGYALVGMPLAAWSAIGTLLQANGSDAGFDGIDRRDSHPLSPAATLSNPSTRAFGQAWHSYISDLQSGEATAEQFMRAAIQGFDLYAQCSQLATIAETILGRHLFTLESCSLIRRMSLSCLNEVSKIASYDAALVEALIIVIRGQQSWPSAVPPPFPELQVDLVKTFWRNPPLVHLLDEAIARYPFEFRPLLLLSEALVVADVRDVEVLERLKKLQTIAERVPEVFAGYEAAREQELDNCFILREDLPVFPRWNDKQISLPSQPGISSEHESSNTFLIRQGTEGLAFSKDHHPVIAWKYEHSLTTYMGKWLYQAHQRQLWWSISDEELQATIIDCLRLLHSIAETILVREGILEASAVLLEVGEALPPHTDIFSLITDILEDLLARSFREDDADFVRSIAACFSSIATIAKITPGRVWPFLARVVLSDGGSDEGRLLTAVSSYARAENAPALVSGLLDLSDTLMNDIVTNAAARAGPNRTQSTRFEEEIELDPGIPAKQMAHILSALTRFLLDFLQDATEWCFISQFEQAQTTQRAIDILRRLLRYSHVGMNESTRSSVLSPLCHAGHSIVSCFLYNSPSSLAISRLLAYISPLASASARHFDPPLLSSLMSLALSSVDFITSLLSLADSTRVVPIQFLQCLSEGVPNLIRVYASYKSMQTVTANLLARVAQAIGGSQQDQVSLFASFGAATGRDAVAVLGDLTDLADDSGLACARWRLFSACISNKQSWFSSYLITGTVPSRAHQSYENNVSTIDSRDSVLTIALDTVSSVSSLSSPAAVASIQFVADALNYWPWSFERIRTHPRFLSRMTEHLDQLDWQPRSRQAYETRKLICHAFGASLICEIFAMCFHSTRLTGNTGFMKEWSPQIPLLDQPGFKDPYYQKALHRRFQHNFEGKFPGLLVEDFKKGAAVQAPEDSYYDLECVQDVLREPKSHDHAQASLGFWHEFEYASNNLCLVAAQKQLIIKWQLLCVELVKDAADDDRIPKKLAYVAHECLEANKESEEAQSVFTDLRSLRMELATAIVQKLVGMQYAAGGMHSLLDAAWDVLRAGKPDFESAFAGDEVGYYRKCVKLLLLCVRAYAVSNLLTPSATGIDTQPHVDVHGKVSIMLEIAVQVVAKGFRSLASQLHEQPATILPADFVLLTSLLQVLLQVQGAENTLLFPQLAIKLADFNVGRYATALFSWSDRITSYDQDPVYGEISVTFLAEMSVLPSLAETLATDGVLSRLNVANIMTCYQRSGGAGPFDVPRRMHKIWTRGILPLVLNVLIAVGAPIAAEVATFLNNFTPQLELASNALDGKSTAPSQASVVGGVTYNAACEAHTLSLLASLLDRYRVNDDADIPELRWDRAAVKEDVETWVQGTRAYLRERIMPTDEKEVALLRTQPIGGGKEVCEVRSRLEEAVWKELKGAYLVLNGG
ncbi:MAG: hypothetical protein Q9159_000233 [Coniocarpon cinnabarinum]